MRHSGGSRSYVTGCAPQMRASVAYERKPGFGTSTSSPGFTYAVKIANSASCVPAVTHTSVFGSKSVPSAIRLRSESVPAFAEYCHGIAAARTASSRSVSSGARFGSPMPRFTE